MGLVLRNKSNRTNYEYKFNAGDCVRFMTLFVSISQSYVIKTLARSAIDCVGLWIFFQTERPFVGYFFVLSDGEGVSGVKRRLKVKTAKNSTYEIIFE